MTMYMWAFADRSVHVEDADLCDCCLTLRKGETKQQHSAESDKLQAYPSNLEIVYPTFPDPWMLDLSTGDIPQC